jgi:hypothetical protein
LLFERNFFAATEYRYENSFKKGKIYQLGFSGELKKTAAGVVSSVAGNFEMREVEEIFSFLRNFYKEKEQSWKRKSLVETDLAEKSQIIQEINEERWEVKKELAEVKTKFDELQFAKTKLENERITPAQHQELLAIQRELTEQLNLFKEESQNLSAQLKKINQQDWTTTLEEKIQSKKIELEKVKSKNKLDNNVLASTLEFWLTTNEQLVHLVMEKVPERVYSPTQKQLVKSWTDLRTQITFTELRNLWRIHSEIIKMQFQHHQWVECQIQEEKIEAYIVQQLEKH